jgi:antitoxin VapB
MSIASVFINNRTQAVRLPADMRLPDDVKRVHIRAVGRERVIAPLGALGSLALLAESSAALR